MIIGTELLLKLVKEQKLVEGLSERELTNPEGTGFDLRVGKIHRLLSGGFLGVSERETPKMELIAEFSPEKKTTVDIKQGEYYVVTTVERVNIPQDIAVLFQPRTTLFRSGTTLFTGTGSPGYCGELSFGLVNNSPHVFRLEMGARVVHALFHRVEGNLVQSYRGQWQGGRVTTEQKEVQI